MPSTFGSKPVSRAASILTLLSLLSRFTTADPSLSAMTYIGCFSSSTPLTDQGSYTYQTSGYCQPLCVDQNQAVLGLSGGSDCWCGDQLPASNSKVGDDKCDSPCDGYDKENCGGDGFYSVYLSGTEKNVPNYSGSDSSSSSAAPDSSTAASSPTTQAPSPTPTNTNTAPTVVTSVAPGTTIVVTQPAAQQSESPTAAPSPSSKSDKDDGGGANVAGIAAGVVVGVVAAIAIAAALFFWLRSRRRQAATDEYKRTQVSDFMRGAGGERKVPGTGYSHMSDTRLDPEAGRRNSAGSIADDQDYSRRILRVANPDSS